MAIVFSRREKVAEADLALLCLEITAEGAGTLAISSVLSPNSYLVLGQGPTTARLEELIHDRIGPRVSVRRNPDKWPPMHTPIVRQRNVPDRAAVMLAAMPMAASKPLTPIFSLTTGRADYGPLTAREILRDWADHPQRLWDAVHFVLDSDIRTIVHVGPAPNVIPATFSRVADNVAQQLAKSTLRGYGTWAMAGLASRRWLANLLPRDTALLRAPLVQQVMLEDWLIEHQPSA
jgi:[acyl-carrier-protein] S-malonyltransferase